MNDGGATSGSVVEASGKAESQTGYGPDDGLLVLEGVTRRFGGLMAVDDLSFTVQPGEILGFIGPNGAGKTTTFNCVTGILTPQSGAIYYDGEDITGLPPYEIVQRGVARTFQTARPLEDFTVAQNIGFALLGDELFSLTRLSDGVRFRVLEIARQVGFEWDDLERHPDELAHAGLIKLELARALAADPDLLLVDEVFAGLAAGEVETFVELFWDLRDEGYTFVVIDHNMRGLLELIDRAIVINFGAKIAAGTPEEIRDDEQVQSAYLGEGSA